MPLEIVTAPEHDRKRSLGWLMAAWIEYFCIHGPGDIQGTPLNPAFGGIPLSNELTTLTVDCYALDRRGRRLYRKVFYSRPKGANKSGYDSWVGLGEALGPCRFDGWAEGGEVFEWGGFRYEYRPGEPMGRRVTYPFVRVMATEEGQTGNVYDSMYLNLTDGPLREAFPRADGVGLTRVFIPGGGEIVPSTAASASKEGGKETHAIFDETWLYYTPELIRMHATVMRNLTKRADAEGWGLESSTMFEPGRNSIAEGSHRLAMEIRDGKSRRTSFYYNHRQAPVTCRIDNDDSLVAGLTEAYGDAASYMDFELIVDQIRDPQADEADGRRHFLNIAETEGGERAYSVVKWRQRRQPREIAPRSLIVLGFDGSLIRDATALVATRVGDGYQWPIKIWLTDGEPVDSQDVDNTVDWAFNTYQVWRMYGDPSKWETYMAQWAGRHGHERVIGWPTSQYRRMALAVKAYHGAINAGDITHDGNEEMARHIGNTFRQATHMRDDDDEPLWLIRKERKDSPNKIDAAMAGTLSWAARLDAVAAGAKEAGNWLLR